MLRNFNRGGLLMTHYRERKNNVQNSAQLSCVHVFQCVGGDGRQVCREPERKRQHIEAKVPVEFTEVKKNKMNALCASLKSGCFLLLSHVVFSRLNV